MYKIVNVNIHFDLLTVKFTYINVKFKQLSDAKYYCN